MSAVFPIAMMIAGYLANQQAEKEVEDLRNEKSLAETLRQQQLGKQADAKLKESLDSQSRQAVEQDQAQSQANREQKYQMAAPSGINYSMNPSAPKEVRSEMAARIVDSLRKGRQQSQALGALGGRSDAQLQSQIGLMRSGQDLDRIGGASRASSAILPYELNDANRAGEQWKTIADLFNTAGSVYGMYGMTQAPVDYAGFYQRSAANPTFSK